MRARTKYKKSSIRNNKGGRVKLDEAQPGGKRDEEKVREKKEERRASEMVQSVATKWSDARWSRAPSLTVEKCASIHSHDKLWKPRPKSTTQREKRNEAEKKERNEIDAKATLHRLTTLVLPTLISLVMATSGACNQGVGA
ncbi:uncharacterized protein UBRO_20262 [Ustilago bromivora]|uniref:Uncharacterized protein n=1 Tax=Ustilago bromivora TaxID=307758 RepID=A0A1K0G030_9BASI|nr:uncharacterized protein UBRO_20262 [Ustilago bromivora]